MRLGQTVYWVTHDKATGEHVTVRVNVAGFHARDGQTVSVMERIEPGSERFALRLIDRPTLFVDRAEADVYAMGTACRLLSNFSYKRVTIIDGGGVVREFLPPVEVKASGKEA